MAYLVCFLVYNVTEATFYSLNFLFIVFLAIAIERPMADGRCRSPSAG